MAPRRRPVPVTQPDTDAAPASSSVPHWQVPSDWDDAESDTGGSAAALATVASHVKLRLAAEK